MTGRRYASYRYRVRPGAVQANLDAINAVLAELHQRGTPITYAALQPASEEFLHIVCGDPAELTALGSFQRFQQGLPDRLLGEVLRQEGSVVGAHCNL